MCKNEKVFFTSFQHATDFVAHFYAPDFLPRFCHLFSRPLCMYPIMHCVRSLDMDQSGKQMTGKADDSELLLR